MKKLVEFPPEVAQRLQRIGEAIAKAEDSDPVLYTYTCGACQDTGFQIYTRKHRRLTDEYVIGYPCGECLAGQMIQERMDREQATKIHTKRFTNRHLQLVERKREIGEEPPPPEDDSCPPF